MTLLDKVLKGPRLLPPRIILLGEEKIGKSTFASQFPDPIFITVQGETGVDQIDTHQFPAVTNFEECLANIKMLVEEEHDYKTVVLDSSSALEEFVWDATLRRLFGKNRPGKILPDVDWGQGFNQTIQDWARITRGFDLLRTNKNMTTIIIGHVTMKRKEDKEEAAEYYAMDWTVQDKGAGMMKRWADCVLYAKRKVFVDKQTGGFNKTIRRARQLNDDRLLFCTPSPARPGGGRGAYGLLKDGINLNYKDFMSAVAAAEVEYAQLFSKPNQPQPSEEQGATSK